MTDKVLIVDDEGGIRQLICGILEDEGYETAVAANSSGAYEQIAQSSISLVVLDIWLEGSNDDGMEVLQRLKAQHPFLPVIMISGHGTVETAVHSIRHGAYDFIEKPFKSDRLLLMVKRALEASSLMRENQSLKSSGSEVRDEDTGADMQAVMPQLVSLALDNQDLLEYPLKQAREIFERYYLDMQVQKFNGNISRTAEFIGMERSALHRKLKTLQKNASGGSAPTGEGSSGRAQEAKA